MFKTGTEQSRTKRAATGSLFTLNYLVFWIVILDDLNGFANIKAELIHILFDYKWNERTIVIG